MYLLCIALVSFIIKICSLLTDNQQGGVLGHVVVLTVVVLERIYVYNLLIRECVA